MSFCLFFGDRRDEICNATPFAIVVPKYNSVSLDPSVFAKHACARRPLADNVALTNQIQPNYRVSLGRV